jgi:hypothetical protein
MARPQYKLAQCAQRYKAKAVRNGTLAGAATFG